MAFVVTMGIAVTLAFVQQLRDARWRSALLDEYRRLYGDPPSGLSPNVAGVGHVAGGAVGGILGAAAFFYSQYRQTKNMDAHQRSLHDRLKALEYGSAFHGVYLVGVFLAISLGCIWLVSVATGR